MAPPAAGPRVPTFAKFVIGGVSGVTAQTVTHPLDVLKLKMQISKGSFGSVIEETMRSSGIRGFYVGLSAALLRQVVYGTTRLGVYTTLVDIVQERLGGRLSYPTVIGLGMLSGVMASFFATPTDLVLVRMVSDLKLPAEKRRNYGNAVSGLVDIWRSEGFRKLWRGAVPTMGRAAIVNGAQLGTYTRAKMMLLDSGYLQEGVLLQFLAAMISGIVMCTASLPVDAAKTRIQNWEKSTKAPGVITIMVDVVRAEGVLSLWRGFLPYYLRAGPNTIVTMICVEQFHRLYWKFYE